MTTLDKQALEKALDTAEHMGWFGYKREIEETIRAYEAALPEARRYWAWTTPGGDVMCLYEHERVARNGLPDGDRVVQVETREVRQP